MATFDETEEFTRDFAGLSREQKRHFLSAARKLNEDLEAGGQFRRSLRVSALVGWPGIFELTYEGNNGRATFAYGESVVAGKRHVIWRRVGTHTVFGSP